MIVALSHLSRPLRTVLGVLVLGVGLLAGSVQANPAHAAVSGCRTDPLVTLSNGMVVDLSAIITDTTSDVQGVTYTLHGPKSTTVVSVNWGTDPLVSISHFSYVADDAAASYDTYTLVTTKTSGIAVSATTSASGPLGQAKGATVTGVSGQTLHSLVVLVI